MSMRNQNKVKSKNLKHILNSFFHYSFFDFFQAFWLLFAYLYEFRNYDVLLIVWIASLGFLATNLYILEDLVRHVRSIEKITDKKVKKFE